MFDYLTPLIYIFIHGLFCVLVGKFAEKYNHSFVKFMILSFIFSPILIFIILLVIGEYPKTKARGRIDLSAVGKIAMNSGGDKIICPFCKTKINLEVPPNEFTKMNCIKCNKKITTDNVLFDDQ